MTRRELPDEKLQVHFAGHAGDDTSDCRRIHCGYEGQKSSFCKRFLKFFFAGELANHSTFGIEVLLSLSSMSRDVFFIKHIRDGIAQ